MNGDGGSGVFASSYSAASPVIETSDRGLDNVLRKVRVFQVAGPSR